MHKNSLLLAMASALLLVGCAGSAYVRGSASVTAPDLVYVSPGVQVIADYNEPIFYSDNFYWRSEGNVWYRSSDYTGGWVRFDVVPVGISRIERPSAYIHYHGEVRASSTPAVRDHRDAAPPQAAPAQVHDERNDQKAEQKEERKEQKAEQKEERKEQKAEQKEERKEQHKDAPKGHH